jgi:hypothetical protein
MDTSPVVPQLNVFELRGRPLTGIKSIQSGAYFLVEDESVKGASVLFVLSTSMKNEMKDAKLFDACLYTPTDNKWSGVKHLEVKQEGSRLFFSVVTWHAFALTDNQLQFVNNRKPQPYFSRMYVSAKALLEGIQDDTSPKQQERMAASLAAKIVELSIHDAETGEKLADDAHFYHEVIDVMMDHWKTMQNKDEAKIIKQFITALGHAEGVAAAENEQWLADYREAMD